MLWFFLIKKKGHLFLVAEHVCGEEGQDRALAVCALQAERPP